MKHLGRLFVLFITLERKHSTAHCIAGRSGRNCENTCSTRCQS